MTKLCAVSFLFLTGCGLFRDEFEPNTPKPVNTTFRYPGVLEVILVCNLGNADSNANTATNLLRIRNVSTSATADLDVMIEVFSGPNKTFSELVRRERVQFSLPIVAGGQDSVRLPQTNDFISNRANILVSVVNLSGVKTNPLSGAYTGSFTSYKDNKPIYGGLVYATIDIHGNLYASLQGENEFNTLAGTVSPDSILFATLRKENENLRKVQVKLWPKEHGALRATYVLQTDDVDSTVTQLIKN